MSLLPLARQLRDLLEAEDRRVAADAATEDPAVAAVLEAFPGAPSGPTAGAGRTWQWPQRQGPAPPDFDNLVPAREWVERTAELAAWQARVEALDQVLEEPVDAAVYLGADLLRFERRRRAASRVRGPGRSRP